MERIQFELRCLEKNQLNIAGIDEVGRGPLAGPMVTAAVVFSHKDIYKLNNPQNQEVKELKPFFEIRDSKKISQKKRERLSEFIKEHAKAFSIYIIEPSVIDAKGISSATQIGFYTVLKDLNIDIHHTLTDNFEIKALPAYKQTNIVKGDSKSISIAAASIIAKVYRDNMMVENGRRFPEYGFDGHKGYGTKQHIEALKKYGPCEIHRKSFEPIKSMMSR